MKKHISTIIIIVILLTGLSLLLYPTVSDYWNSFQQSQSITEYEDEVANLEGDLYREMWERAVAYNKALPERANRYYLTDEEYEDYESLLNISGTGIMGYVEIPCIDCKLPIYHGTDEGILQIAVGHITSSSLPVGGEGTHCVLSGHRGLPSAKLFTNLDEVTEGDVFFLKVLNETLAYEVDQIRIVLPEQVSELDFVEGMDYCTLVTCTPYGVNTHRLLVRGHRIEMDEEIMELEQELQVGLDAVQLNPKRTVFIFVIPVLAISAIGFLVYCRWKK